ncbi:MAG: H-type lectin domain-containing protein [Verrucomicrobiales bacterium]|nr:H-type lectin domain-containing protein [Verrucomicrobiales bacterium]
MSNSLPLIALSSSVCVGHETEGWNLDETADESSEDRRFRWDVWFDAPFSSPPVVHLGLTGFDLDQCSSDRLRLSLVSVTEEGFQVELSTWRDSRVYSAGFQWLAIGS